MFLSKIGLLICFLGVCMAGFSAEIPQHLRDVRVLQENVLPENNSYRHAHSIVEWKGFNGAEKYVCHTDCSGLIDALLIHSYHFSKEHMARWLGKAHAKARDYFRVINENNGFDHIHRIKEILPGDFVAMKFLPGAGDAAHDTGHIMVVNQLPKLIGPREKDGLRLVEWSVEIIDCSRGHGESDTRYREGRYWPGIGRGVASLYTDDQGVIEGYSWTPAEKSIYHARDTRPLAVGRIRH